MALSRTLNLRWFSNSRQLFSSSGKWDPELTLETKKKIEAFWNDKINERDHINKENESKKYILPMFPYPSGRLHMGHIRVYALSDAFARFYRMKGKKVVHPIGWDAFGLPAENAAIQNSQHPKEWTISNIASMKQQMKILGVSFDWDKEFATCEPSYYKWTQYIFLKMFHKGLVSRKQALVNWDPVDQTVLADEQVDANGLSWRSGAKVEKRFLKQWFFKTTMLSENLYSGLDDSTLKYWEDISEIQKEWIGSNKGYIVDFKLYFNNKQLDDVLTIWTENPEFIYGATFISVSSKHFLNCAEWDGGILPNNSILNVKAMHPFTCQQLPILLLNRNDYPSATEAILGIPGENAEDYQSAVAHNLPVVKVLENSLLLNSAQFTGLKTDVARKLILAKLKKIGIGGYVASDKFHDWLISRQRYWGTPIPIIHCSQCKIVPVPFHELPVELPHLSSFMHTGDSPLLKAEEWLNVKCPRCGSPALRETDTMDTFVDSMWYFLRFLDPHNCSAPIDPSLVNKYMPVDLYIGGKEHAVLHLFYSRFLALFLHSEGLVKCSEPFLKLVMMGMVRGKTYFSPTSGQYLSSDEVDFSGKKPVEKKTGDIVETKWEKMSKSKHNGVDPDDIFEKYGVDSTRLYILDTPPSVPRDWTLETFPTTLQWQRRLWLTVTEFRECKNSSNLKSFETQQVEDLALVDKRNFCISKVNWEYEYNGHMSAVMSRLQKFTKVLRGPEISRISKEFERSLAAIIVMLAPLAPHFAAELWSGFCDASEGQEYFDKNKSVHFQPWPEVDPNYKLPLYVNVGGTIYGTVYLERHQLDVLSEEEAIKLSLSVSKALKLIKSNRVKRTIYELYPGCKAEIVFITKRHVMPQSVQEAVAQGNKR